MVAQPGTPRPAITLALGLVGIAAFAGLSIASYRADRRVNEAASTGLGSFVGPSATALASAGQRQLELGLAVLNDPARPPGERLRLYRAHLEEAEGWLERSLRARPANARVLGQLAAVRFELDPPLDEAAARRHLDTIRLAAGMAPDVPRVQVQLGELLLRMGRAEEATAYFGRAIDLDARISAQVVAILSDSLFSADAIRSALPARAEVLSALERPYRDERRDGEYLALVEERLDDRSGATYAPLLIGYTNACLRARVGHRVVERLGALGPLAPPETEATRLLQISRAHAALGDPLRAVEAAREAERLVPSAPVAEQLGGALVEAQDADAAIAAYRRALSRLARDRASAAARARLYRKIGQAEEAAGAGGRAFEAYRRAVELDPAEPIASRRLREMRASAGVP